MRLCCGEHMVAIYPDSDDQFRVRVEAGCNGATESITYRLRPDTTTWQMGAEEKAKLEAEFRTVPSITERDFVISLDIFDGLVRAWIDGQFIAEWDKAGRICTDATLECGKRDDVKSLDAIPVDVDGARQISIPFGTRECVAIDATGYRGRNAHIACSALDSDPKRALVRVPKRAYDHAYVVCSLGDGDANACLTLRVPGKSSPVIVPFTVPDAGRDASVTVTVPIDTGAFQSWLTDDRIEALELDVTRPVARDDGRFPAPVDTPNGVVVHAITLECAPVEMVVTSEYPGHVFEDPEAPAFSIRLRNTTASERVVAIRADVVDPYGTTDQHAIDAVTLAPHESRDVALPLPQDAYGRFGLTVTAGTGDDRRIERRTTFAFLPPDTRKATDESPFGTWCFFEGHGGASAEVAAPLMRKAGIRWTLANFLLVGDEELIARRIRVLREYGISASAANVACIANTCNDGKADVDAMIERMRHMPTPLYWLVFWETALSGEHMVSFPRRLVGETPRPYTDEERRVLDNCVRTGLEYARRVRKEFPDAKLVYGNGYVPFIDALLADEFPRDLIDGFGLDFDMFLSMPELQPGPLHAPFSGLYQLAELQEIHGCAEKPRYLTEAIYCSQDDGWLTEREQADRYVRSHLLGLAAGVVNFGMTGELWDPGGWYRYSHYGPVGYLHEPPELNPRESYCAYATMTRVLDRATFDGFVDAGSPSVYALRFARHAGGSVFAVWTIRGTRELSFVSNTAVQITDLFGNTREVTSVNGRRIVVLNSSPQYIEGVDQLSDLRLGTPESEPAPSSLSPIVRFDRDRWHVVSEPDPAFDALTDGPHGPVKAPYVHASLRLTADRSGLRVGLGADDDHHPLSVRYARIDLDVPVELSPDTRFLVAHVDGNSSWGRLVYTIRDGAGRVWKSIVQEERVDFDGARHLVTPLPDAYRKPDVDPRGYHSWKCDVDGETPVGPYALTGFTVEVRSHVVRGAELLPVTVPEWRVSSLHTET